MGVGTEVYIAGEYWWILKIRLRRLTSSVPHGSYHGLSRPQLELQNTDALEKYCKRRYDTKLLFSPAQVHAFAERRSTSPACATEKMAIKKIINLNIVDERFESAQKVLPERKKAKVGCDENGFDLVMSHLCTQRLRSVLS